MDIGAVASHSGLSVATLRFYEQKGLIRSIGRHGLRRIFSPEILQQLEFVALGHRAGFTLEEIAAMFSKGGKLRIDRKLLLTKAASVERDIQQLTAVRDGLRHVAHCPAPDHLACPKFQKLLRLAGKAQAKGRPAPKIPSRPIPD